MSQTLRSPKDLRTGAPSHPAATGAQEALVVEVLEAGRVSLRSVHGEPAPRRGRVAAVGYVPHEGDRVLVVPSADGLELFVVGVLVGAAPQGLTVGRARAEAEGGAIVVRDEEGRAVLRYDPETGGLELSATEGDLKLTARTGRVIVESGKELLLRAEVIESDAREVRTRAEYVGFSTARWDLRAGKITERARNVFRDVSGLLQTRAKRASLIAESTLSLFSRRTSVRSKEDTSIDGKRVLLG